VTPENPKPNKNQTARSSKNMEKARAEYQGGKLDALLRRMTAHQQLQWQRAVVEQALWYIRPLLKEPQELHILEMTQQWLNAPSDTQATALIDYVFQVNILQPMPGLRIQSNTPAQRIQFALSKTLNAEKIKNLLLTIAPDSHYQASTAGIALAASKAPFSANYQETTAAVKTLTTEARRWQLDTAWAILNDAPIPLLINASADDMEAQYRAGNLTALITHMNIEQQQRFRLALMHLLLRRIPPLSPQLTNPIWASLQACMDAAQHWLDDPLPTHAAALRMYASSVEHVAPPHASKGLEALADFKGFAENQLVRVAVQSAQALTQTLDADLTTVSRLIVQLDVSLLQGIDIADEIFDEEKPSKPSVNLQSEPTRKQAEWWQVEAAWAIINDVKLPSLS
jgi:hypothetical protein